MNATAPESATLWDCMKCYPHLCTCEDRKRGGNHWILCDDCTTPIRECSSECERTEDHHMVNMPHPNWRRPKIFPTLCGHCSHERAKLQPDYKV